MAEEQNQTKKAIVTGVTGQDGPYLAKFLLSKGYQVYGTIRRASVENEWRIRELGIDKNPNFKLVDFDLTDAGSAYRMILEIQPDEIYNLAGQSSVPISFHTPSSSAQINALGPLNILEAIRTINPKIKMYLVIYFGIITQN